MESKLLEFIIFFSAGLASLWVTKLLNSRKWNGMLQHLMIIQNLVIASAMFFRAIAAIGFLPQYWVHIIGGAPMLIIQVWLAWYLQHNIIKGEK